MKRLLRNSTADNDVLKLVTLLLVLMVKELSQCVIYLKLFLNKRW